MKKLTILLFLIISSAVSAQINVVPMPAEVKMQPGFCIIKEPVGFITSSTDPGAGNDGVEGFKKYLQDKYGIKQFRDGDTHSYDLPSEFLYGTLGTEKKQDGYYEIEVTADKVYIKGTAKGKFYAFETLKQLIQRNAKGQLLIPHCIIKDHPRFVYRGMHFDVSRHFYPISYVKKYIDYLATYKFNTFHWHLTDDQGWRIEIKKYPKLMQIGGYRNGTIIGSYPGKGNDSIRYGGFYTQAQIKEVVKYAAERHIDVIPEIEMPGHASAAIAAYPQLSCFPEEDTKVPENTAWAGPRTGKQVQQTWGVFEDVFCPSEYSFNFLQDVIDEILPLFPSKYIHIGGDESPKEAWKRSAFCQQLIKEKNLKDEHGLQSYFIQRMEKYINSKGKMIIGWDEILEGGLAPNATVMSWRGESGGIAAAKQEHDVVMTPGTYCYLDHSQTRNEDSVTFGSYLPLETIYNYDPVPTVLNARQAKHILGAQGNMWTEYMKNPAKVEYMLFPRITALSEVLWTAKEKKSWKDYERRLPIILERLDQQKINYSKAYYELQATVIPTSDNHGVMWKLESKSKAPISINFNREDSVWFYTGPQLIQKAVSIAYATSPNSSISQSFYFNKATGKKISIVDLPSKSYPGNGAFTLVDGIQNAKGLARSTEFLGFAGTDLDVTIDLSKTTTEINKVTVHVFDQNASWIYLPSRIEVTYLPNEDLTDEIIAAAPKATLDIDPIKQKGQKTLFIENKQQCRYIRIVAKNFGTIPSGNSGAGNKAWLFIDEIEVE